MLSKLAELQKRIVDTVESWGKENPTAKISVARQSSLIDRLSDGEWAGHDVGPQEQFTIRVTDSEREDELAKAFYLCESTKVPCPPPYFSGK